MKKFQLLFCCFFLIFPATLFAAVTGKISGRITDASTGEALLNANVIIVGTTRGAVTDVSGKFTIEGVPVGKYTLRATLIGYEIAESKSFEVQENETVTMNVKLKPSSVQLKEFEVLGEGKIVNVQATSSTKTLSSRSIEQIPNVKSVQDVMAIQPGVVKMGNNVFLRGGRANEVQYIVDGISVNDAFGSSSGTTSQANEQISQFNAGVANSISASGLNLSANAIQTMSVTTSGFDAEFGNAQSGVISISTKSGSENYTGSVQMRSDRINDETSFNEKYYSLTFGGPEPLFTTILPSVGIEPTGNLTFFITSDFSQNDGAYNYQKNGFFNPLRREVKMRGFFGDVLGFRYFDYLSNSFTFNGKIKYDYNGSDQISYAYRASFGTYHDYRHVWRDLADSSLQNENGSSQHTIQWTHFLGTNSFYRLQGSVLDIQRTASVAGRPPPFYSTVTNSDYYDPSRDGFYDFGTSQSWSDRQTRTATIKFDLNTPLHELHYLKTGFEMNWEAIHSTEISYPNGKISYNGRTYRAPYPDSVRHDDGLWPGYGVYRWNLLNYPNTGSMYAQDNIQFFGTNLHVGLRYDYFWYGEQVLQTRFVREWSEATGLYSEWVRTGDSAFTGTTPSIMKKGKDYGGSSFLWYLLHGKISPRLAINFPITERIGFFFNYGHFMQYPERTQLFRTPYITGSDITVGNPNLQPQRTIQYESGFENQLSDYFAISLRGFYKDIFDYVTVVPAKKVAVYLNSDYASSRGFEVSLNKATSLHFSGNISYSYQIAKGRKSNPFQNADNPKFQLPREIRLDWDQRHTINFFGSYRVEANDNYDIFGIPFVNDWGVSITASYGSGFPYTPTTARVNTIEDAYKQNTAEGPNTMNVNLSFTKGFSFAHKLKLNVNLDVLNLLDRQNITSLSSESGFNVNYGRPYRFGDFDYETRDMYQWYKMPGILPPYIYSAPRQILLGLRLNWG
ncbi:MAG: TonB-dependent receptor [Ignavibacteria bacterium]|nr:TonB-dependent receptor [Ignavibacteria bacterium]